VKIRVDFLQTIFYLTPAHALIVECNLHFLNLKGRQQFESVGKKAA